MNRREKTERSTPTIHSSSHYITKLLPCHAIALFHSRHFRRKSTNKDGFVPFNCPGKPWQCATVSQLAQNQDSETEATKWNALVFHFITYTCAFPTVTCQNVLSEKGPVLNSSNNCAFIISITFMDKEQQKVVEMALPDLVQVWYWNGEISEFNTWHHC